MKRAIIINGDYKGKEGYATIQSFYGNILFYCDDREPFYRLFLNQENIQYI